MLFGNTRFDPTGQRIEWTSVGQVARRGPANPCPRCLLPGAPRRPLRYRVTVPKTGCQLVKWLVGWRHRLNGTTRGKISAPPIAQLRGQTKDSSAQLRPALYRFIPVL